MFVSVSASDPISHFISYCLSCESGVVCVNCEGKSEKERDTERKSEGVVRFCMGS